MGPWLLIAAGGFIANISWLKWPDLVIAFGEQRVLTDLKTSPPTYIAIVYHDFLEFGTPFFGKNFGQHIFQWIHENYFIIQKYGAQPFVTDDFGIQIFKRKPSPNK